MGRAGQRKRSSPDALTFRAAHALLTAHLRKRAMSSAPPEEKLRLIRENALQLHECVFFLAVRTEFQQTGVRPRPPAA